ncbi:hypothetical protein SSX86_025920 [Deinandra increscens subsp. villosa]|uniref:Uncharacterized protein n=1 Tax=Deinandra increscens subsp. villosa TaxID=3103831 RepID=A0AAP0GMM4_9ASTR
MRSNGACLPLLYICLPLLFIITKTLILIDPIENFTMGVSDTDTICSFCHCAGENFVHDVWDGHNGKAKKICTSCVLLEHDESFCPTCFDMHVFPSQEECIGCSQCRSFTHARCISGNDGLFKCSTCRNADSLIFDLKEDKQHRKVMDMKAARLLLTAAKIVKAWTSKAHDEAVTSAIVQATNLISDKKRAVGAVERFMKFEKCNDGPSLLDP